MKMVWVRTGPLPADGVWANPARVCWVGPIPDAFGPDYLHRPTMIEFGDAHLFSVDSPTAVCNDMEDAMNNDR